jgi:signal transduction histidine kinase
LSEQPANANVSLAARAGEIRALVDQALEQRREDGKAAESSLRRAIELATAARVASLEALARHELGCLLRRKLETKSEALGELHRALELRMELKDVAGQIDSLLELGTDAYQSSDLANALPPLHEAERLCSQSGNLPGLALAQEVLSGVYSIAGRNEDALTYAERCLDVAGQVGDRKQVAHALDNLACVESELGRHDKACAHFQQCLGETSLLVDLPTRFRIEAIVQLDLASAMLRVGKHDQAKVHAEQAIAIAGRYGWSDLKGDGLLQKACATLAPEESGNVEEWLRESYQLIQPTGNKNSVAKIERALSKHYRTVGDHPKAFEFLERAMNTESAMRRDLATHQIAQQQAREKLDELMERSARAEMVSRHKSEFLANMSHELRTPLNAILGFSEMLQERMFGELNEKQADYVNDIHESGRHLLSLINDILDLSKVEAGRMELELASFDVPQALSNAVVLVRERAQRHGIEISLSLDPGLGEMRADERKLKQIMLNLLSNAVKFTPDGGRIAVTAKLDSGYAEIKVTDSGVGIAPEEQPAVFQEFKQVGSDSARKAEGTGLGLALTKRLVELHGGEIHLQSVPGEGTTFAFTLPVRL